MWGVNKSSHLSAVGDPNPLNQALYLVAGGRPNAVPAQRSIRPGDVSGAKESDAKLSYFLPMRRVWSGEPCDDREE